MEELRGRMGQRGRLWLSFERRGGRTALVERFASAPFGAVRANYPDGSGTAEVQITNPSGGVLGGDRLEMEVVLSPGASTTVITQAANNAYRGAGSSQRAVLRVEGGDFLEYLPHHLIPYPHSDYRQTTRFHLAPDGDPEGRRPGSHRRPRPPRRLRAVRRILVRGGLRPGPPKP